MGQIIIQQSHCMFAIDMLLVFISESVDAVYSLTKTDRRPMFAAFVNILNACCA